MSCQHTRWLTLSIKEKEVNLLETDRVRRIVSQLPNADKCYPSLFIFVGADTKDLMLKKLFSSSNVNEERRRGCITLHVDSSTPHPILYASSPSPFPFKYSRSLSEPRCHHSTKSLFFGENRQQRANATPLYTHILYPFSDAFCFFRNDFKSWAQLTKGLLSWINKPSQRLPKGVNPVLVIVIEPKCPDKDSEQESKRDFNHVFDQDLIRRLTPFFSEIKAVYVPRGIHPMRLEECLTTISTRMRHERHKTGVLYSATHLEAMLRHALEMRNHKQPVNFIEFSRSHNPVPAGLSEHMSGFLTNFSTDLHTAASTLASALLLDAFPPGMHDFVPADVFDVLYWHACQEAAQTVYSESGKSQLIDFVGLVMARFCHMTEHLRASSVGTAELHRNNLRSISKKGFFLETQTCSVCLIRNAEPYLTLPCRHRTCETCMQIFGHNHGEHPWLFRIDECPHCGQHCHPPLIAKLRNPCRGLRVLTLDGGGCRGIIPLTFLQMLQNRIGLPYPVQDYFDVTFAPSSGGLIAFGLCIKGLSVEEAVRVFGVLAKRAFEEPNFHWLLQFLKFFPSLTKMCRVVMACILDSYYSARGLEDALKEVFGNDLTMSNSTYATAAGLKLGIPVTTAVGCEPCLFTNYQGQPSNRDYRVILPENNFPAPVWQLARCTSAAPWFFRPKYIPGIGTFQDGGLWMNNPVPLVDSEIKVIDASIKDPLVVSVGTGLRKEESRDLSIPSATAGCTNRFIPRLYDALMKFMCGKRLWNDYQRKGRAGTSLRFDINFEGREPNLDQVDRIEEMAALAREQFDAAELQTLANSLVCSLFHFELKSIPSLVNDHYSGNILCDLTHDHPAFRPLLERLASSSARFIFNDQPIEGVIGDGSYIDCGGNFCKGIKFQGSGDEIAITLQLDMVSKVEHISGSPFSIPHRVRTQGLDAIFGEANHKKRKRSVFVQEDRAKRPRLI